MRLIVLTDLKGQKIYVNPAQICAIYTGAGGCCAGKTCIQFAEENNYMPVSESVDIVAEMVESEDKNDSRKRKGDQ